MADATLDLATVWDQIRERLATSLSPQQNAMLNLTRPLGLVEDTAVLAAPNEFTQTVLESRMRRVLAEALSEQFGRDIRVAVQLEDAPAEAPDEDRDAEPDPPSVVGRRGGPRGAARRGGPGQPRPRRRRPQRVRRPGRRRGLRTLGPRRLRRAHRPVPPGAPTSASCGRPTVRRPGRSTAARRRTGPRPPGAAPTTRPTAGDRDWGGSGDGRSADVLPFDLDGPGGDQRSRSPAATAAAADAVPRRAARPGWTRA